MNRKNTEVSLDDITRKEISIVEANDKLAELEKERLRDKKIIAEYKDREKATARALILYERKIKFLKENAVQDLLKICEEIKQEKQSFNDECQKISSDYIRNNMLDHQETYSLFENKIYDVCNSIEKNSVLTNDERAFISNKKTQKTQQSGDMQSRFDKLKLEFSQKIGTSVLRKPGRPKKSEQSIIADIGLRNKVERKVDESENAREKIDNIFYNVPTAKRVTSTIPKTADSSFDFDEALNPDISLKDIMNDLMTERDEKTVVYDENTKIIEDAKKQSDVELLESGFMRSPNLQNKKVENKTVDPIQKKPTFDRRFLSIQNIVKNSNK